jgi:glycosyltransferase involved in cell wall biosynthesis
MKVGVVSRVAHPLHGFGGLERHVGALVKYLAREGAEVTLVTTPPEREAAMANVHVVSVAYRKIPWPRRSGFVVLDRNTNYLLWNLEAGRRMMECGVDIVHVEAGAGFGYARMDPSRRRPFVIQAQGLEEFKAHWLKRTAYLPLRLATRYAVKRAQKVIVPDHAMEEEVGRILSVPSEKTTVIPLALDLEEVERPSAESRAEVVARWSLSKDAKILLSVGRLESYKGFGVLAKALARVKERSPSSWIWVLVGSGPQSSELRDLVSRLGIAEATRFTGRVSDGDLSALYDRADLVVHPTLYEGSSLVTLEAMAHAKPVVGTRVGGIPDKIEEGINGFLVPPGDEELLCEAVVRALSLGSQLAGLGAEGRRRVESGFNWAQRQRQLMKLYEQVIEEQSSSQAVKQSS